MFWGWRLRKYSPDQPRDEDGRWTDTGAGSDAPSANDAAAGSTPELNPRVIDVGGDEWNRQLAVKLEREYVAAKPALERIVRGLVGKDRVDVVENEDDPGVPDSWDTLTEDQQQQAEEAWKESSKDSFIESESSDYYESGMALDDAKASLADGDGDDEWLNDALSELKTAREEEGKAPLPFTDEALLGALTLKYDNIGDGKGDFTVGFDDAKLDKITPEGAAPPNQGLLPGFEGVPYSQYLTKEMREEIIDKVTEAFEAAADDKANDMPVPEHLYDSIDEQMSYYWSEMSDHAKFEYVQTSTSILSDIDTSSAPALKRLDKLPEKYDPLGDGTDDGDAGRTRLVARGLSVERSVEIMHERGINTVDNTDVGEAINDIWRYWKSSSTSDNGVILQAATAEELGGRYRDPARKLTLERVKELADEQFKQIGGFDGVRAIVRGTWETSQYLLDKAGIDTIETYRALRGHAFIGEPYKAAGKSNGNDVWKYASNIDQSFDTKEAALAAQTKTELVSGHTRLPDVTLERNGAQSTSVRASVSNEWGSDSLRVVLRIEAPRTAALSVPAFGVNVHHEQEVVLAGTAWKNWDAWYGAAPDFKTVPIKRTT